MFQIGDLIIYGGEGVCRVEEIGTPDIPAISKDRSYYTLKPLYRDGKTFTPVDTTVPMRPIITPEQAQMLIAYIPQIEPDPCPEKNLRLLSEHYNKLIQSYNCADLVQLIRTVYAKNQTAQKNKKKIGQLDERYMRKAEDMLYGELAIAFNIPKDEVETYITEKIQEYEKNI